MSPGGDGLGWPDPRWPHAQGESHGAAALHVHADGGAAGVARTVEEEAHGGGLADVSTEVLAWSVDPMGVQKIDGWGQRCQLLHVG